MPVYKFPGCKFAVQMFSHPEIGSGSMVPPKALLLDNNFLHCLIYVNAPEAGCGCMRSHFAII